MRSALRAAVAVACLWGFYAIAAGAVGALAYLAVRVLLDTGAGVSAALALALLLLAVLLAVAVSGLLRRGAPAPVALLLERHHHPDLWDEVADLAEQVGTRAPDEIRLVAAPTITVTEDVGRLGLVAGTRRLDLGVPLLLTLTRSQAHALVAHDLAHHRGGRWGLAAVAWRGQQTLGALAERHDGPRPLRALIELCARLYLRVARDVSRDQELEADRISALIAGSGPAVAAVRQVAAVQVMWDHYLAQWAYAAPRLRPLRLFEGFADLWEQDRIQMQLAAVRDDPVEPTPSPFDSHPPTEDRVAALLEQRVSRRVDDSPARHLLRRPGWHALELEAMLGARNGLRAAPWEEIAEVASRHHIVSRAAQVPERLDLCVDDLVAERAHAITGHLLPPDAGPDEVRDTAVELVTAAIEAGLLERGIARVVASESTLWLLVDDEGYSLDVASTVAKAYADDEVRATLRDYLCVHGLATYRATATV